MTFDEYWKQRLERAVRDAPGAWWVRTVVQMVLRHREEAHAAWDAAPKAATAWRPMESAPKDKTYILISGGTFWWDDQGYPPRPRPFGGVAIVLFWNDSWRGDLIRPDEYFWHDPTGWLPLPEPQQEDK